MLLFIFVKLYYASIVCARRRARLLVCFDRPVGWKQAVRLHLIKRNSHHLNASDALA